MKQESKCTALDYILTCVLIFQSGSILAISHYYKQINIIVLCVLLVYLVFVGKKFFPKQSFISCMFLVVLVLMNTLRGGTKASSYIAVAILLVCAYIIASMLSLEKFIYCYTKIMVFLAAVSIPLFFIGFAFPSFVFMLPEFPAVSHVSYHNMLIYEYHYSILTLALENRNSSIFWEPGAYAFFINLALFFLIEQGNYTKKKTTGIIILVAALITTLSTTGFVVFGILILLYLRKNKGNSKFFVLFIFAIVLSFLSTKIDGFETGTTGKFSKLTSDSQYFFRRLDIDDLRNAFNVNALWPLIGLTFEQYETALGGAANAIIYYSVSLGLIFGGTILAFLLNQRKSFSKDARLVFALLLLISFSSESLILKPIILYFCFAQHRSISEVADEKVLIE